MAEFFATYGFLIVSMMFAAMLGLSLYLPLMAGQLSLASPGFYALGGYIAAIISTKVFPVAQGTIYPLPLVLLEMLLAAVACAILALVVGVPALRLRGIYLALATIAFVEVLQVLALNLDITGGAVGIFGVPQPFFTQIEYAWIALPMLVLTMLFVYRLERIRVGRAFVAIREDELAAGAMGIDPTVNKVLSFTIGAVLAGLVGAVSAHFLNTWNARQGTFDAAIAYLAFVLIGGSRTFWGPVIGAMVLTALPEVLRAASDNGGLPPWLTEFMKDGRFIIYGLLLVLGCIFLPRGVVGPFSRMRKEKVPKAGEKPDELRSSA
jgi:branched-chain amino acid transport system permease protein